MTTPAPARRSPGRALPGLLLGMVLVSAGPLAARAQEVEVQSPDPAVAAGVLSEPVSLTVGLGYIPSVQFAQFYLAEEAGYYDEAGLDVTFQNKIDPELITLVGQGAVDIGMGDGTSLIPAVSQGIPVLYAATIFARFPNVLFSLAESGIEEAADLAGRSVGIPGRFGSSWVALQALLGAAGLTADDVEIVTYPDFGHAVAVAEGQVDAAIGFLNNEPVQLTQAGRAVNVISIDDVAPLPGPGLVVGRATLESKREALRAFTAATLRAMEEIIADPQRGLEATFARVPELAGDPDTQLAVLKATVEAWQSDTTRASGLGSIDMETWKSALDIMTSLPDSVVAEPPPIDQLVTEQLLP